MKKFTFITLAICTSMYISAQETSLEVDCQNPGWLSNLINYTQQQTVRNIKVTGYINANDLSFLGSLNINQQLKGIINLEDVQIVGATNDDNNKINQGYFGSQIEHLLLPKSLVSAKTCLSGATVDTLTVGGEALPEITSGMFYKTIYQSDGIRFNKNVKHLILREGVTTIKRRAFYNGDRYGAYEEECVFESVTFPSSLVTIEDIAFAGCYALKKADFTDNIEEIGQWAFANLDLYSDNDTIILPNKLKIFHLNSFAAEYYGEKTSANCYVNQHFYLPEGLETVDCNYVSFNEKCFLHLANDNPPSLIAQYTDIYQYIVAYVPKNSVEIYKNAPNWQNTTILPEPNPAKSINIEQESIEMVKGTTRHINASVVPEDADDKNFTWSTSDYNVVSISQDGLVTAISSGEAKLYATLNIDKTIVDSCTVKVYQPVNEVKLNITTKSVKVGETFNLAATISPSDADNKNVIWSSEDSELATVDNGKVTALKPGMVRIFATSEYAPEISAFCEVEIIQPATGIILNHSTYSLQNIGDIVQLEAKVSPDDATNKEVNWKSSNEDVCFVSNGTVVAVGYGTSVIIATTKDGDYMATCTIKVGTPTGVDTILSDTSDDHRIYTPEGKTSSINTKGIKIIESSNGNIQKVFVK